jgi:predicted permease
MAALTTLCPVFFMLALGYLSRIKGWITPEQKSGANAVIFKVLFPLLILYLIMTAEIHAEHIQIIGYVVVCYLIIIALGKVIAPKLTPEHASTAPYLLSVVEGGNVALPLYLSIVGASSNTVILDLGGTIVAFIIVPVLVAKQAATGASPKQIIKNIFSNSFVICVLIGLFLNLTGLYQWLLLSPCGDIITGVFSQVTKPIVSMILFILGYDLHIERKTLAPILKLMAVKILYYAAVIGGFFLLFPDLMTDHVYMMAPIIYFMSPTGFGLMPIIEPLYKDEEDAAFTSAFISMYMIVTLLVYACVVVFIA